MKAVEEGWCFAELYGTGWEEGCRSCGLARVQFSTSAARPLAVGMVGGCFLLLGLLLRIIAIKPFKKKPVRTFLLKAVYIQLAVCSSRLRGRKSGEKGAREQQRKRGNC